MQLARQGQGSLIQLPLSQKKEAMRKARLLFSEATSHATQHQRRHYGQLIWHISRLHAQRGAMIPAESQKQQFARGAVLMEPE